MLFINVYDADIQRQSVVTLRVVLRQNNGAIRAATLTVLEELIKRTKSIKHCLQATVEPALLIDSMLPRQYFLLLAFDTNKKNNLSHGLHLLEVDRWFYSALRQLGSLTAIVMMRNLWRIRWSAFPAVSNAPTNKRLLHAVLKV